MRPLTITCTSARKPRAAGAVSAAAAAAATDRPEDEGERAEQSRRSAGGCYLCVAGQRGRGAGQGGGRGSLVVRYHVALLRGRQGSCPGRERSDRRAARLRRSAS